MAKGWFIRDGALGDRTLEQQLKGLQPLLASAEDKTILDVGCAEGLISLALADAGARYVHGIEMRPDFVDVARSLRGPRPAEFTCADANEYKPQRRYDIVIMLAVLHKLRDPTAACMRFADAATHCCVIRLPPEKAPLIVDNRSGNRPHDIQYAMQRAGFKLSTVTRSHFDEWCGYFWRTGSAESA
jgi:SAM-dependent methyltransferase